METPEKIATVIIYVWGSLVVLAIFGWLLFCLRKLWGEFTFWLKKVKMKWEGYDDSIPDNYPDDLIPEKKDEKDS